MISQFLDEIRATMITAIEAVTPTIRPELPWRVVDDEPVGSQDRRFELRFDPNTLALVVDPSQGIFSNGNTWFVEMMIVCAYSSEWRERDEILIQRDGLALWHAIRDGGLAGVVAVLPPTWEDGPGSEEGMVRGAHIFGVRFFADDGS